MVEKQDRLAHRHAVFGAAKTQHIHPGFPAQLCRRAAQESAGIGETGAVHVQQQAQLLAGVADGADFFGAVHAADFGGLGDGDHPRFWIVDVLALEGDFADRLGGDLAVFSTGDQQFGTVGKELRGAAFVGFDVSGFGADHAVKALAQGRQRQGVGRRTVEGEIHFAVGFEQFAKVVGGAQGPLIVTV